MRSASESLYRATCESGGGIAVAAVQVWARHCQDQKPHVTQAATAITMQVKSQSELCMR